MKSLTGVQRSGVHRKLINNNSDNWLIIHDITKQKCLTFSAASAVRVWWAKVLDDMPAKFTKWFIDQVIRNPNNNSATYFSPLSSPPSQDAQRVLLICTVTVQLSVTASSAEHSVTENSTADEWQRKVKRKSGDLGLTAATDMGWGMSILTSVSFLEFHLSLDTNVNLELMRNWLEFAGQRSLWHHKTWLWESSPQRNVTNG